MLRFLVTVCMLLIMGACVRAPVLPAPEPTFGVPEQQETLERWLEGDFETVTTDGKTIRWQIRKIPEFRAMFYMERFVDSATAPDRQELWYIEPPSEAIRIQSWRHVRPHLFAGATGVPARLAREYIYDMRRNENINLAVQWQDGQFLLRTVQPSSSTGAAGHPDSRPNLTITLLPERMMRAEQFTEGEEPGSALSFQRVASPRE